MASTTTMNLSASTKRVAFPKRAGGIALPQRSMLARSFAGKTVAPRSVRVARPAARGAMKVVAEDELSGWDAYDFDVREKSRKFRRNVVRV